MNNQERKLMKKQLRSQLEEMALYFQIKDPEDYFDERILAAIEAVMQSESVPDAMERMRRAESKMHLHCLTMWAKKRALGPQTRSNFLAMAAARDKLANFREKQEDFDAARKYRDEAEAFRLKAMQAGQTSIPVGNDARQGLGGPQKGTPVHGRASQEAVPAEGPDLAGPPAHGQGKRGRRLQREDSAPRPRLSDVERVRRAVEADDAHLQRHRPGSKPGRSPEAGDGGPGPGKGRRHRPG